MTTIAAEPDLNYMQRRILKLAAYGVSITYSAEILNATVESVRWHRKQILRKLDATNMANAVALAYEHGILR